jgi:hypothetical protein
MTQGNKYIILAVLLFLLVSCGRLENKTKQIGDKAKTKAGELIDTALNKVFPDPEPDSFSVRSIVKSFQNDNRITEIRGIQTNYYFIYLEYCVYKGKKDIVLKGVNAIVPKKIGDIISDSKSYPASSDQFYNDIVSEEKNKYTAFFWNFEKLKSYEIYTCIKAPLRHYLIFDKNSDTVYHRIEELRP